MATRRLEQKESMKDVNAAIEHFVCKGEYGEAWKKILLQAPEMARARIICSMYYSLHKFDFTKEELDEYHRGRAWVEAALSERDLKYLIAVMPHKQKPYFAGMLAEKEGSLE